MLTHGPDATADMVDALGITTPEGLAGILRQLRRRLARQWNDAPLTYRELATRTGWAHGVIGDYFAGKTLPPTDRFDILIGLLGATPTEQGLLAAARDHVEELRRSSRRAGARAPNTAAQPVPPPAAPLATVDIRPEAEGAFVDIARRVVWATLTMVDSANRPWSRVVRPLWERRADGLTGWVFARSSRTKRLQHSPFMSLSYWHPTHDTATAQCAANWADERERRHVWKLALHTPPPVGYDPATEWPVGVESPDCALLRLRPWRLTSSPGASHTGGRAPAVWT